MVSIHVTTHPVALASLGRLRRSATAGEEFRRLVQRFTEILTVEATAGLPIDHRDEQTSTGHTASVAHLIGPVTAVPILRAGLGMLDGVLRILPGASIGFVGLRRDHDTLEPHNYYTNLPDSVGGTCLVLEPMIATGGSLATALSQIEMQIRPERILTISLLSAPEGIEALKAEDHPERNLTLFTGSIDSHLDDKGYIVPGLGDAGDRICGGN